jgi:hypothetical protein
MRPPDAGRPRRRKTGRDLRDDLLGGKIDPTHSPQPNASTRRPSGGRSPRRKGSAFEREAVQLLQALGLAAERVPLSGAVKTSRFDHDVTCPIRGLTGGLNASGAAEALSPSTRCSATTPR